MTNKGAKSKKQILNQIRKRFSSRSSDLEVSKDVVVGRMHADLFVQSPGGATSVLQVKNWEPTLENRKRARDLVPLYKSLSNTDNAYVVMPGLEKSDPKNGVVRPDYIQRLQEQLSGESKKKGSRPPKVRKSPDRIIFAAMPFAKSYDDTFEVAIQGACLNLGYKAVRVDHEAFVGDIVAEIKRLIRKAAAVVGDLSDGRPNVLYEIGYAEAARRKIVQICSTPMDKVPFDVRNNRTIPYEKGQTAKLRENLQKELSALLVEKKT